MRVSTPTDVTSAVTDGDPAIEIGPPAPLGASGAPAARRRGPAARRRRGHVADGEGAGGRVVAHGEAPAVGGGEVDPAVAGEAGVLTLELLVEEPDREVGEVPARQLLAAGVGGDVDALGEDGGQGVAAVVADEDAP